MTAATAPKISKWPFFLGDALLLALAWLIHSQSSAPHGAVEIAAYVACVAIGSWISITPFLRQYQAELKFAEADKLLSTTSQLQNLEKLAEQIGFATGQWQTIRDSADKTAATAKSIAEGMASEVKAFNDFIQKTNDGEKATLRLEVEKLRRGEVEWLQVVVRILDHVFALHQAALRARQPGVAEQIGRFQMACVDAARRIGLTPFTAAPGEPFEAQKHQLAQGPEAKAPEGAKIGTTLAAGFAYQGRLIRPAVVELEKEAPAEAPAEPAPSTETPAEESAPQPTLESKESKPGQADLL